MYKSTRLLTISLVAAVLMLAVNSNVWKANALDLPSLTSADDVGQSLECVIVVVGCDGTGSVGSSGDTTIGSNNVMVTVITITILTLQQMVIVSQLRLAL